jgi:hypothetical protein
LKTLYSGDDKCLASYRFGSPEGQTEERPLLLRCSDSDDSRRAQHWRIDPNRY